MPAQTAAGVAGDRLLNQTRQAAVRSEFARQAIALAGDAARLRRSMRDRLQRSPLMDLSASRANSKRTCG